MAESQDTTDATEILQPVLRQQWFIETSLSDEYNNLIRSQSVRCSLNMVKRTFHLEVEQPKKLAERMFRAILLLTKASTTFGLQCSDGESMVEIIARLVDHKYELDYSGPSEVTLHILDFEF